MATSGIWNHAASANSLAATAHATAQPAAAATGSSGAGDDGSTISANDFLTLLVTEMKNQDPTANSDPNAYVNQLVQVNSLEQLININQTLTSSLGQGTLPGRVAPGSGVASVPVSASATSAPAAISANAATSAQSPGEKALNGATSHAIKATAGNLGVPNANPAAQRVAQALSQRTHLD